jgi:hypothetical protein
VGKRARAVVEQAAKPQRIDEWAKRNQVLPRYMCGAFYAPGGKRNKLFKAKV